MTERGHGSNVRGIQTEATFDLSAQVRMLSIILQFRAAGKRVQNQTLLLPEANLTSSVCALWPEALRLRTMPKSFSGGGHMLRLHVSNISQNFDSIYRVRALFYALYMLLLVGCLVTTL